MKSAQTILQNLRSDTPLRRLKQNECSHRFLAQLPPRFAQAVAFAYVRNDRLHLALRHPGYKMELQYHRTLFRDLWNTLIRLEADCRASAVTDVILFVSRQAQSTRPRSRPRTVPRYAERADGVFHNRSTHPKIRERFERMRAIIRARRFAPDA